MWIRRRRGLESLARNLFTASLCLWMAGLAAAQEGFLSIDCGSVTTYVDNVTGIQWVTDQDFIQTGENSRTGPGTKESTPDSATQLLDLRFFRENPKRNCYLLPVDRRATYLVRSTFSYFDFGSASDSINFDLYVNATLWTNVIYSLTPGANQDLQQYEMVFRSNGTIVSICLVGIGGTPFISSLELRQLDDSMYDLVQNGLVLFGFSKRYNLGVNGGTDGFSQSLRYPDDKYDRIWNNLGDLTDLTVPAQCPAMISNSTELSSTYVAANRPPARVMQTACFGVNDSITLSISFPRVVQQYYAALYLQELNASVSASHPRGIVVTLNHNHSQPYSTNVTSLEQQTTTQDDLFSNQFLVTVSRQRSSTLGPLVNAAEFFVMDAANNSHTDNVDVKAVNVVGERFNLTSWTGDPCFPVSWDGLTCTYATLPSRITQVNLSGMKIAGVIPSALVELTQLTDLYLDHNRLEGTIPDLSNLTKLQRLHLENNSLDGAFPGYLFHIGNLSELYVEGNNLTGSVPSCPKQSTLSYRCDGNSHLRCPTGIHECSQSSTSNSTVVVIIAVIGVLGVVAAASISLGLIFFRKRSKQRRHFSPSKDGVLRKRSNSTSREQLDLHSSISLEEIIEATGNFERKIGEGSFGSVYYGKFSDGQEVAVKTNAGASRQGTAEFVNEVNLLSRVHHKNLVSLLGFCIDAEELLLVYAYMSNGTLREHLYGAGRKRLDWITRLDIAVSSAKGLDYLHTACNPRIIHRDVKSSNILLDDKFVAKVADFGLSKSAPDLRSTSGFYTNLKGTPGYFDPEYFVSERLTQKSDVYSFGIVLLEIISGRAPYPSELPDGSLRTVHDWMRSTLETDIFAIVDPCLEDKYRPESMRIVIKLAATCLSQRGINRPDMSKVVQDLLLAKTLEFGHSQTETDSKNSSFDSLTPLTSQVPPPSAAYMSIEQSYNEGR